jgi:hypothetical protein
MLSAIFIFLLMVVIYIHIEFQYKKGEDLEVYEMDYTSKKHLQTVCDMKQPTLFEMVLPDKIVNVVSNIDIPVWDIREYGIKESVDPFYLSYSSFINLAKSDPKGHFFTRKNNESLDIENNVFDDLLKPPLCIHSEYELLAGSTNSSTPLQYHMNDRVFLYVKSGKISIKMTPWRSKKFLNQVNDYDNYEFYSNMNPWTSNNKDIRWIEFDVNEGYIISIPPWWWYSIRFSSIETEVFGIRYVSISNMLAHIPHWGKYYTREYFTHKIPIKKMDINVINNDVINNDVINNDVINNDVIDN